MPRYKYQAVTAMGEAKTGWLEAAAEPQAIDMLQVQGLIPLSLTGDAEIIKRPVRKRSFLFAQKIASTDILLFTQQLSSMLKAGLPLDRALGIQLELAGDSPLGELVENIQTAVRGGDRFADALEQSGKFSRFYVNMVRAGEMSGSIDAALLRLSEYLTSSKALKNTVVSALIYPAILMLVSIISIIALLIFVVPQFSQMFADMGRELPVLTKIVISVGEALRQYWWLLLLGLAILLITANTVLKQPQSREWFDRSVLSWPLIGTLLSRIETARFTGGLSTLLQNGVPMLGALTIIEKTLGNRVMRQALLDATDHLKQGESLTETLQSKKVFPDYALHMLRVGEETGRLEEVLAEVATIYDEEVKTSIRQGLAIFEPMLILFMAASIVCIIFAILLPMMSMADLVQ